MSNYLVDGADLTSVANAIRTKGGTSAQLAFPQGFVDAVEAIPSGSSDFTMPADTIRQLRFRKGKGSDSEIYVDFSKFPNLMSYQDSFNGSNAESNWSKITIKPHSGAKDARGMFYCSTSAGDYALKEIVIDGTLKPSITTSGALFGVRKGLKTVTGLISLAGVTRAECYNATNTNNMVCNCIALQTISFVAGSMPNTTTNWNLSWCSALSDDSLVSIANALKDTYSGTITFHATPKAKLANIMGTVSTDGTLSTFTIDANGTVSLQNFITNTKGATLA